jgi:hypothetical protein
MQPCDFKIQSINSLYYIARGQSADVSLTSNINHDVTHKQTGGRSADATLFAEELVESTVLLLLGFWRDAKSCIVLIDVCLYNNWGLIFIPEA